MNRLIKLCFMLDLFCLSTLVYGLWTGCCLPLSYLLPSVVLSIVTAVILLRSGHPTVAILQVLLVFLLTRNVYYIATHYAVYPFVDSYWDYGTIQTFLDEMRIFVIQTPSFGDLLLWTSGWPLLHTLAVYLSTLSTLNPLLTTMILYEVMIIILFLAVTLLLDRMTHAMNLGSHMVPLGLLVFTVVPFAFFWLMLFKYQTLGIALLFILFYVMLKVWVQKFDWRLILLGLILVLAIVVAHHIVSLTMVLYLFLISLLPTVYNLRADLKSLWLTSYQKITIFLALCGVTWIFIWWNLYGAIVWGRASGFVIRLVEVLKGSWSIESYLSMKGWYPPQLTPPGLLLLLRVRDILIYLPVAIGFVYLLRIKRKSGVIVADQHRLFMICSLLALGLLCWPALITRYPGASRIVTYSIPFIAFLPAIWYARFLEKNKGKKTLVLKISFGAIVVIFTFSSLIALAGMYYAPVHLYDRSIDWNEMGEHNPDFGRLKPFLDEHVRYLSYQHIVADDLPLLHVLLPPAEYRKIERLNAYVLDNSDPRFVVSLKQLHIYDYAETAALPTYAPKRVDTNWFGFREREEIIKLLEGNYRKIFDDGSFSLWENSI